MKCLYKNFVLVQCNFKSIQIFFTLKMWFTTEYLIRDAYTCFDYIKLMDRIRINYTNPR